MPLSPNQTILLRRIIDAGRPVPISEVAEWHVGLPQPFGENAARNALKRLEDRELVTGTGTGRSRAFSVTRIGEGELNEAAAPPGGGESQDSGPVSASRNYFVLEELDLTECTVSELEDLLDNVDTVYLHRATVDARNTEHALRQAADVLPDGDVTLIPVAERMWQPEPVRIRNKRQVSIG